MALPSVLDDAHLFKFRTKICERYVKRGHCEFADKCQYSHDLRWTRRPLWKYMYGPELCPNVHFVTDSRGSTIVRSTCWAQRLCKYSHTLEEQVYHPKIYKTILCTQYESEGWCERFYCPFVHKMEETRMADPAFWPETLLRSKNQKYAAPDIYLPSDRPHPQLRADVLNLMEGRGRGSDSGGSIKGNSRSGCIPYLPFVSSHTPHNRRDGQNCEKNGLKSIIPDPGGQSTLTQLGPGLYAMAKPIMSSNGTVQRSTTWGFDAHGEAVVCIKTITVPTSFGPNITREWLNNMRIVSFLESPDIIHVGQIISTNDCPPNYHVVLEKYRGTLDQAVDIQELSQRAVSSPLPPVGIMDIFAGLLGVLSQLHSIGGLHARLHPGNLAVTDRCQVKLADCAGNLEFLALPSLIASTDHEHTMHAKNILGEILGNLDDLVWIAPEMIARMAAYSEALQSGKNTITTHFSHQDIQNADVWSMGALLFYIVSGGKHPFESEDSCYESILNNMLNDSPQMLRLVENSPLIHSLLSGLLKCDCNHRASLSLALCSPLFWKFEDSMAFLVGVAHFVQRPATNAKLRAARRTFRAETKERIYWLENSEDIEQDLETLAFKYVKRPDATDTFRDSVAGQTILGLLLFLAAFVQNDEIPIAERRSLVGKLLLKHPRALVRAAEALSGVSPPPQPSPRPNMKTYMQEICALHDTWESTPRRIRLPRPLGTGVNRSSVSSPKYPTKSPMLDDSIFNDHTNHHISIEDSPSYSSDGDSANQQSFTEALRQLTVNDNSEGNESEPSIKAKPKT